MALLLLSGCTYAKPHTQSGVAFDVSPQGNQIVFSAQGEGGSDLYFLNLNTLSVQIFETTSENEGSPAFSPDGRHLAYVSAKSPNEAIHIYTCSISGEGRLQVTQGDSIYDCQPSYSRDGKQIVFSRAGLLRPYSMGGFTLDKWDVFVINADGTNLRRITKGNYRAVYSPQFSISGKSIIFGANSASADDSNIFSIGVNGGKAPTPLTTDNHSSDPSRSRDGRKIVFISDRKIPYDYELWQMNANGTSQSQLTKNRSYNQLPRYSADGESVFFLSAFKRDNRFELWNVKKDGTGIHRISDGSLFDDPLAWKPPELPSVSR